MKRSVAPSGLRGPALLKRVGRRVWSKGLQHPDLRHQVAQAEAGLA